MLDVVVVVVVGFLSTAERSGETGKKSMEGGCKTCADTSGKRVLWKTMQTNTTLMLI